MIKQRKRDGGRAVSNGGIKMLNAYLDANYVGEPLSSKLWQLQSLYSFRVKGLQHFVEGLIKPRFQLYQTIKIRI